MTPPVFVIPAGSAVRVCRGCGMPIYWIQTRAGAKLCVEVLDNTATSWTPTRDHDGQGTSHWATCPARETFRKPRPPRELREPKPRKDLD